MTRKINGRFYRAYGYYYHKSDAQKRAKELKKEFHSVRVYDNGKHEGDMKWELLVKGKR
jgi:hypothetical protein